MIDDFQTQQLTSGGDCSLHYHSSDTRPTHDTLSRLHGVMNQRTLAAATHTVEAIDDILLCSATCTVTLPLSNANGREVEVIVRAVSIVVTIVPTGADTVMGATSLIASLPYTALHFKAVSGGWILI